MMTAKEKIQRASASVAFDGIFKYVSFIRREEQCQEKVM